MTLVPPTTIGDRIRAWRLAHKMSLRAFADAAGIDRKLASKYESGTCLPSRRTLDRICRVIGGEVENASREPRNCRGGRGGGDALAGVVNALTRIVKCGPDLTSDLDRALVEAACLAAIARAKHRPEPAPAHAGFWAILTTMLESRYKAPAPPGTSNPVASVN